jgi:RNA polymerase sigma-70 factor (ECF subfamily)
MSNIAEDRTARPADDDLPLVTASQEGDLGAFEALVLKYQKRMLNIAFRIIGDQEDAGEVVQDVFVSAYRHLAGFRREAKFSTWLTAIAVNLSKNRLQQVRTRHARTPLSLDAPLRTDDGELLPDPPSREPSVLDRLESRDVTSKVQDCIQELVPEFREVIVLRDLQDLDYEEISSALKLAIGTVKSRLFRAREAVKDCLKKALGDS